MASKKRMKEVDRNQQCSSPRGSNLYNLSPVQRVWGLAHKIAISNGGNSPNQNQWRDLYEIQTVL